MFCDLVMFPFCVMTTTTTKIDSIVAGSIQQHPHLPVAAVEVLDLLKSAILIAYGNMD